ncbi:MAG: family 16 glycoside hydrolase [Planctomycetota bacterium]
MIRHHRWIAASLVVLSSFQNRPLFAQEAVKVAASYARTASVVSQLQNDDGGFAAERGGLSSVGSTNSAVRVLKHVGGSIPNVVKAVAYVRSCFVAGENATGTIASVPGGKADLMTTCMGLLAWGDLQIEPGTEVPAALKYLAENAKTYEEVRMSIAAFEAVKMSDKAVFAKWTSQLEAMANPDGTFGEGDRAAFATGGTIAAFLRMGLPVHDARRILTKDLILKAQKADGGWSDKAGANGDFGSTYRIMRCMFMLHEKPDLKRLYQFIDDRRTETGLYAAAPGEKGNLGSTYTATILLWWARQLENLEAAPELAGFTPLFNGVDLSGWNGDKTVWNTDDGQLIGASSTGLSKNNFLASDESFQDFILKFAIKLKDGQGNSGMQFRSERGTGSLAHEMIGYQADLGEKYWGCLYDESRRNKVLVQAPESIMKRIDPAGWNSYTIRCLGPQSTLSMNGSVTANYRETDESIPLEGHFAAQVHSGKGPFEIRYKDIMIQRLPRPEVRPAEAEQKPGFQLRTLQTPGHGNRKYTLFLPANYAEAKSLPTILFLHGSGERGSDGIVSAQIGLGAAVLARQADFPAIVIFAQAREGWAAGKPDAQAALATLDEVAARFKVDPNRVILTGLSMGGRGAWEIAAANRNRFSCVVPICSPARLETANNLKSIPLWSIVGDKDRVETVRSMRAMTAKLMEEGSNARYSEYRGVGHNSWDRAYNDPEMLDWMLAQKRNGS